MTEDQIINLAKRGDAVWSLNVSDDTYNNSDLLSDFVRSSDFKNATVSGLEHYSRTLQIQKEEKQDKSALIAGHYGEDYIAGLPLDKYYIFNPDNRPDPDMTMAAKENKNWKAEQVAMCAEKDLIWVESSHVEWVDKVVPTQTQQAFLDFCKNADKQVTCLWTDPETGVKLRSRTDFSAASRNLIIDCKTTACQTIEEFIRKQVYGLRYKLQAQMQIEGARATGYMNGEIVYMWLGISKVWPYNIFLLEYSQKSQTKDKQEFYRMPLASHAKVSMLSALYDEDVFQI